MLVLVLAAASFVVSPDRLITSSAVGPVQLGMTIAEAQQVMQDFAFTRTVDAEGAALVSVQRSGEPIMTLFANEPDPDGTIDMAATIVIIEVPNADYRTSAGVGPQMALGDVERAYGRLIRIRRTEIEHREYAEFENQPAGMVFRVTGGDGGDAGLYQPGADITDHARPGSHIQSISVQRLP